MHINNYITATTTTSDEIGKYNTCTLDSSIQFVFLVKVDVPAYFGKQKSTIHTSAHTSGHHCRRLWYRFNVFVLAVNFGYMIFTKSDYEKVFHSHFSFNFLTSVSVRSALSVIPFGLLHSFNEDDDDTLTGKQTHTHTHRERGWEKQIADTAMAQKLNYKKEFNVVRWVRIYSGPQYTHIYNHFSRGKTQTSIRWIVDQFVGKWKFSMSVGSIAG